MIPPQNKEEGLSAIRGLMEKAAAERQAGRDGSSWEFYAHRVALIWFQRWADEAWVREFATLALREEGV